MDDTHFSRSPRSQRPKRRRVAVLVQAGTLLCTLLLATAAWVGPTYAWGADPVPSVEAPSVEGKVEVAARYLPIGTSDGNHAFVRFVDYEDGTRGAFIGARLLAYDPEPTNPCGLVWFDMGVMVAGGGDYLVRSDPWEPPNWQLKRLNDPACGIPG